MLILGRKEGEQIILEVPADVHDKKVVLTIVELKGNTVRIGIEADRSIVVDIGIGK